MLGECELASLGPEQRPVVASCKYSTEAQDSTKDVEFIYSLSDY
jgi:hypothetical protein